jgi:hypothetical protein
MTETIEELGVSAVDDFLRRIVDIPPNAHWQFHDEARRLETEVPMVYKATVIETKKLESLEEIARAWAEMGRICGKTITALSALVKDRPDSNAAVYHDRLVALGARCQRFQTLHS